MLKLGLRSVLAHRLRFVLCTVAVVLGIAFVGGAMVFTDTLSTALKKQLRRQYGGHHDHPGRTRSRRRTGPTRDTRRRGGRPGRRRTRSGRRRRATAGQRRPDPQTRRLTDRHLRPPDVRRRLAARRPDRRRSSCSTASNPGVRRSSRSTSRPRRTAGYEPRRPGPGRHRDPVGHGDADRDHHARPGRPGRGRAAGHLRPGHRAARAARQARLDVDRRRARSRAQDTDAGPRGDRHQGRHRRSRSGPRRRSRPTARTRSTPPSAGSARSC